MLYTRLPAFIIGFHGCDAETADRVVNGKLHLRASRNDYDWLGQGIYFWENDPVRAKQWALAKAKRAAASGKSYAPAVIGATIDLGQCLNLLDATSNKLLRLGYNVLDAAQSKLGLPMPINATLNNDPDILLRRLDCAVINSLHDLIKKQGSATFDTVRAAFIEGLPVYPNSTFRQKNHVQVCVRNRSSIKGYFHVLPYRRS
jgi:hypothetical protein